jgi:hypothetical protein
LKKAEHPFCEPPIGKENFFGYYPAPVFYLNSQNMQVEKKTALFKISDSFFLNTEDFQKIKKWMLLLDFEKSCADLLAERKNFCEILNSRPPEITTDKTAIFEILKNQSIETFSIFKNEASFQRAWTNILESDLKSEPCDKAKAELAGCYQLALYGSSDLRSSNFLLKKTDDVLSLFFQ